MTGSPSSPPIVAPMSSGLRELRVWQEAVTLGGDVIRAARQNARRETQSITDSVMSAALSVGVHIAEGYGHPELAHQRLAYLEAKLALLRLETILAIARHAELIPGGTLTELTLRAAHVTRLLVGYLVYLDRELAASAAAPRSA